MPRTRKKQVQVPELEGLPLPEGWKITDVSGDYALVRIPVGDIAKVRMVKLPEPVREYFRERQREYRARLKKRHEG
jgi:hypothetical protein